MFRSLLNLRWPRRRPLSSRQQGSAFPGRSRRPLLFLEPLEDRVLLSTVTWTNPNGGDWDTASNWSGNQVPGAADDVVINSNGFLVTHKQNVTDTVHSVQIASSPVTLSAGTLNITSTLSDTSAFGLAGGTLGDAQVQAGTVIAAQAGSGQLSGTLNGVTLDGTLDAASGGGTVTFSNNLTLGAGATVELGNTSGSTIGSLLSSGTGSILGSGSIVFGNKFGDYDTVGVASGSGTLTIDTGITIHGTDGTLGANSSGTGSLSASFINKGTIQADGGGGSIILNGASWTNQGTWSATFGETLDIAPTSWTSSGTIAVDNSSAVELGGSFTTAGIGTFSRGANSGKVYLMGTLTNSGSTLTLNGSTGGLGTFILDGGTLVGGTVTTSNGAVLSAENVDPLNGSVEETDSLNGVTLNGTLDEATFNSAVTFSNNLTLVAGATVNLGNASGSTIGTLLCNGGGSILGSGDIVFGSKIVNYNTVGVASGSGTLTIDTGITIHGSRGTVGANSAGSGSLSASFINKGTIQADGGSGTSIILNGASWTNQGNWAALTGATLNITPSSWSNTSGFILLDGSSTVDLGGSFTTAGLGTFSRGSNGGTVNVTGTLTNTGSTLTLDGSGGVWGRSCSTAEPWWAAR